MKSAFEGINAVLDQILEAKAALTAGKQKKGKNDVKEDGCRETTEMKSSVKNDGPVKEEFTLPKKVNEVSTSSGASAGVDRVTVQYHKIREFKITGGVVGAEENAIDLTDIQFQMVKIWDTCHMKL